MTCNTASASDWTRVTPEMMSGEALEPYAQGVLASGFLEPVTPHEPGQRMLAVFSGEIWVALFEFTGGENRAVFFPGDELVYVVAGTLTLTDADSAETRTFSAGEYVFIPKGWKGAWANEGFYREIAVCSRDWLRPYARTFQDGIVDAERRTQFLSFDPRDAARELASRAGPDAGDPDGGGPDAGGRDGGGPDAGGPRSAHIHGSDLLVRVIAGDGKHSETPRCARDVFVQLLEGSITLRADDGASEEFVPGDCFVVSGDSGEEWQSRDGYQALVVQAGAPADYRSED